MKARAPHHGFFRRYFNAPAESGRSRQRKTRAKKNGRYASFTRSFARLSGRTSTFMLALGLIVAWAVTGPFFDFSDTWQLVVNTATTIVTFLMVFVIQNTQNRDTQALQIKLDELIRATEGAHNALFDLEELDEEKLDRFRRRYQKLAREARAGLARDDTGTPQA